MSNITNIACHRLPIQEGLDSHVKPLNNYVDPKIIKQFRGDSVTAVIYSRLLFIAEQNKWEEFTVTYQALSRRTGLTFNQVRRAITKLSKTELMHIERRGWNNRKYYTVQRPATEKKKKVIALSPYSMMIMSANCAIILAQLRFRSNLHDDTFDYTIHDISRDTGLSWWQVQYSIEQLAQQNYIEKQRRCDPARNYYRVMTMPTRPKKHDEIQSIIDDYERISGKELLNPPEELIIKLSYRLSQGYNLNDFKVLHRFMAWKWEGWERVKFAFVPRLLYGHNFEEYMSEAKEYSWIVAAQDVLDMKLCKELQKQSRLCYTRNPGCASSKQAHDPKNPCFYCTRHTTETDFLELYKTAVEAVQIPRNVTPVSAEPGGTLYKPLALTSPATAEPTQQGEGEAGGIGAIHELLPDWRAKLK